MLLKGDGDNKSESSLSDQEMTVPPQVLQFLCAGPEGVVGCGDCVHGDEVDHCGDCVVDKDGDDMCAYRPSRLVELKTTLQGFGGDDDSEDVDGLSLIHI